MKIRSKYFWMIIALAIALFALASCKKSVDGQIQDESLNRSFTPTNLSISTARDSAKIKWNAQLYAIKGMKYTVDLSTDSLFSKIDLTKIVDTTAAVFVDPEIKLNTPYFARVKANSFAGKAESKFLYNLRSFRLTGQQYLRVVRDFEISSTSVLIHWFTNANTAGLTSITFTPATGTPVTAAITAADIVAGQKTIAGLIPETKYTVQLLAGAKSKGIISVTTQGAVTFTTTLSPADNLATAITNAADGAVIGLNPGTYNLSGITYVTQKSITIRSVSNNPADTKVLSREINLVGTGAGITLAGIEFNGNYSGTSFGTHFLQLQGTQATTNVAATFTNIKIDNCIIHDYTRCILRGNYGSGANVQQIGAISVNNSVFYNIDQTNVQGYYMFSLEKLQLNSISLTKSTFYNLGSSMINMSTNLSTTTGVTPAVSIDYCTLNNIGGGSSAKYLLLDANANKVVFNVTNNIIANSPISGTVQATLLRSSNGTSTNSFWNNNYFKLLTAPGGSAIPLTGFGLVSNLSLDLGWTPATNNFLLTPTTTNTAIFTASTNGSTIGDPRWAY